MPYNSIAGSRYFLLFKDDYSHYRTVNFLKNKSDVFECINRFIKRAKNETGYDIKILRSDNGTEYVNSSVEKLLADNGIRHQKTVPYTPEQNGSAEREIRTLVEAARTMIFAKNLNMNLWAEAINTAVYVINRSGTSTVKGKTPYCLWFNKESNFSDFKVFGSDVYIHVPKQLRHKLDAKSTKGIFVGYSEETKGYRISNTAKNKIEVASDVIFNEVNNEVIVSIEKTNERSKSNVLSNSSDSNKLNETVASDATLSNDTIYTINDSDTSFDSSLNASNLHNVSSLMSYDTADEQEIDNWCGMNPLNEVNSRLRPRNQNLFAFENIDKGTALIISSSKMINEEPETYEGAIKSENKEEWINAMNDELNSLIENKTWCLVELPPGKKAIDNK